MIARCIRNSGFVEKLTNNMIYEIENTNEFDTFVSVMLNGRMERGFHANRFEEVTDLRIGDIVQVATDLVHIDGENLYGYNVNERMLEARGMYGTIKSKDTCEHDLFGGEIEYKLDIIGGSWTWTKPMFELFKKSRTSNVEATSKDDNIFDVFNM